MNLTVTRVRVLAEAGLCDSLLAGAAIGFHMFDVPTYLYCIDATDRLTFVSDEWIAFAQENDAQDLVSNRLLGVEIWSFIEGKAIRDFYQALFDHVRVTETEVIVPFRCDSPNMIRQMELAIRPAQSGEVELEGRLLSIGSRDNIHLFSRHARRADRTIPICSFCRRVAVSGRWLDVPEAIYRYGFFSGPTQPKISEQICPSCAERGI